MAKRAAIVVFGDELDKACAAFTIANAAAASGMEVTLFFSCWGVNLLRRPDRAWVGDRLANRFLNFLTRGGAPRRPLSRFNFLGLGGLLMRRLMKEKNMQSLPELIADAKELGVKFLVCDNPMAIMGLRREDLIDEVDDIVGVASFIKEAAGAELSLFI